MNIYQILNEIEKLKECDYKLYNGEVPEYVKEGINKISSQYKDIVDYFYKTDCFESDVKRESFLENPSNYIVDECFRLRDENDFIKGIIDKVAEFLFYDYYGFKYTNEEYFQDKKNEIIMCIMKGRELNV